VAPDVQHVGPLKPMPPHCALYAGFVSTWSGEGSRRGNVILQGAAGLALLHQGSSKRRSAEGSKKECSGSHRIGVVAVDGASLKMKLAEDGGDLASVAIVTDLYISLASAIIARRAIGERSRIAGCTSLKLRPRLQLHG